MEFTFVTAYDQKATTAMARVLRKTLRKKHSRRSHVFGWIVFALALLLVLPLSDSYEFGLNKILTGLVCLVLLAALIWEDSINGYVARKRMLAGTTKSTAVFTEEGYTSEVELKASGAMKKCC